MHWINTRKGYQRGGVFGKDAEHSEDYRSGKSSVSYPERIKHNVHAQAFYGVITALFDDAQVEGMTPDFAADC